MGTSTFLNKVSARQLIWRRSGRNPGLKVRRLMSTRRRSPRTFLEAIPISGCTGSGPLPCYGAICGFRSKWCGRRPFLGREFFQDSSNALRGFCGRRLGYLRTRRRAQPGRIERVPEEIDREDRAPAVLEGRNRANPGLRVSHRGASFSGSAGSSQRGSAEKRDFGGSSQHKTRSAEKLSSGVRTVLSRNRLNTIQIYFSKFGGFTP
jgi:hypothetical protein